MDLMINDGVLPVKVWKMVKEVRREHYEKSQTCEEKGLFENNGDFFSISQIRNTVDKMSTFSNANFSSEIQDIPKETLDLAGEMFVYLNSCPSPLISLYRNIFLERSSTEMLITLTEQKKRRISPSSQEIANILYRMLESIFGFDYNKPSNLRDWKEKASSVKGKLK